MDLAAFGLYLNKKDADHAVEELERNGFEREDISLLAPERSGSQDFVYEQRTDVKEGTFIGAFGGFLLFGLIGLIMGLVNFFRIDQQAVAIQQGLPSWFTFTVIGCVVGLFFGAASGALAGIGTPKSAAKRYGFYLKEGGIVLSVHLKEKSQCDHAKKILELTRAQDIAYLKESKIWDTIIPEKRKLAMS